ncbi:MAG: hypothetical protein WAL71_02995 [Terriglobales bacterium]
MKVLALKNCYWLFATVFASLVFMVGPQKSFASDTEVTCNAPQVQLSAGKDGTKPRVTIVCSGGSSEGAIIYFAAEISANATVAAAIPGMVQGWVLVNGPSSAIKIYSNLSDTSGVAWGCGAANCRILDQLLAY